MKLFATEFAIASDLPEPLVKRFHPSQLYHSTSKIKIYFWARVKKTKLQMYGTYSQVVIAKKWHTVRSRVDSYFLSKWRSFELIKDYEKWKLFDKLHHLLITFIRNFYTLIKRYREWLWITKISDLLSVTINDLKVDVGIS